MKTLERWRAEARTLQIKGRALAWWASDEADERKPWLLLIHGYPTSSWDWTAVWPLLRPHFRIAALDMLGFGLSEKPRSADYSIALQADYQEAFLESLGVGEAHLLAHDYGDTVAQELLARHAERSLSFRPLSVVLLNGGLYPEQHRARAVQKLGLSPLGFALSLTMSRARLKAAFDGVFGPKTKPSEHELDAYWTLIRENGGEKILHKLLHYIPERKKHRARWVGALEARRIPTRLIIGGADPVSGAHLYEYYRRQTPNADAVLLPEIGHYPQMEAPQETAQAFLAFHDGLTLGPTTATPASPDGDMNGQ